jgi:glycosyltransferase involved in cell wall biosynthesis
MFIHDIFDCERLDNRLDLLIHDNRTESWQKYISRCSNLFTGRWKRQLNRLYSNIMPLYSAPNTIAFSVSDYSANAIRYYFPEVKKNIEVCYSPLKKVNVCESVENEILRELVSSGEPYLLMIAADRRYKNPQNMMKVFMKVAQEYPHLHLLTLRYGHTIHPQHHDIHFLSESDLENAYKHAHALFFGSFFEGFGYPPIEALKYGTPTVASNVTSIPEILGDAGIYFSQFYPADIYRAIQLVIQNRDMKRDVITRRYEEVTRRQEEDLRHLVDILLTP